ncbi:MAG: hypothetical protein GEU28_09310 [Dehalococcoidia bacterium]|nr:hypothetical protein [Dehalococcoidia bacterium]
MKLPPPLRPYQLEVLHAIWVAVLRRAGLSLSVMMSRQAGKNEVSAQVEMLLLLTNAEAGGVIVKTAPTRVPQLMISRRRLLERLRKAGAGDTIRSAGDGIEVRNASITFLSGQPDASVQGHTASLLLEVDEAQHMDAERFERDFRPMVLTTGAPVVFYGTSWGDDSLLERMKAHHLALEAADGVRRHFEYDYQAVGRHYPAYLARALEQRALVGEDSRVFMTQYRLIPLTGEGRMFTRAQVDGMRGDHDEEPRGNVFDPERRPQPASFEVRYVAGLDIAGQGSGRNQDRTVLTVARADDGRGSSLHPLVEIVKHRAWRGVAWDEVHAEVTRLARYYGLARLSVDATGIGHHVSAQLARDLGSVVERLAFSGDSKSKVGFELSTVAGADRLRMYRGETAHTRQFWHEVEQARAVYARDDKMSFEVPEAMGHDDYLISLALCVHAAITTRRKVAQGFTRA